MVGQRLRNVGGVTEFGNRMWALGNEKRGFHVGISPQWVTYYHFILDYGISKLGG